MQFSKGHDFSVKWEELTVKYQDLSNYILCKRSHKINSNDSLCALIPVLRKISSPLKNLPPLRKSFRGEEISQALMLPKFFPRKVFLRGEEISRNMKREIPSPVKNLPGGKIFRGEEISHTTGRGPVSGTVARLTNRINSKNNEILDCVSETFTHIMLA